METLQISLPEPLKAYVDAQVAQCGFETPSDYIERLVSHDRNWHSCEIETRLLAAVDSPDLDLTQEAIDTRPLVGLLREKLEAAG